MKVLVVGNGGREHALALALSRDPEVTEVNAGEVFIVPAGVPHAVAPGSHGTLVIIDR